MQDVSLQYSEGDLAVELRYFMVESAMQEKHNGSCCEVQSRNESCLETVPAAGQLESTKQ